MNRQMEMSFMRKGGLKDDGLNEDPVSGNKVPSGSMAKEVRDDIPAMLSEGEYVVPADVLRFYGVNFFEDLRNKAKSGLTNMEKNGRIGGTPLSQEDISRNMQQSMQPPSQPMPPVPPQPMAEGGTSGITESPRPPISREEFLRRQEEKRQLDEMDANPKSREDVERDFLPEDYQRFRDRDLNNEEPRATIKTYEVDGRMQNAIVFKDGERMFSDEILRRFQDSVSASEPIVGKETSRIIDQYLNEANPTKEEFIKYFFEQRRLASGGVIGASNGPDMSTYTSGYNPATSRYAMFQGTSSQQQAQAAAQEAAAGEELSFMRPHYDKNGNKMMIQYKGLSAEDATVASGQEELLKQYPLTEDEWNAYKEQMNRSGDNDDDDGGGSGSVAAGSSTDWMKGIDFNSTASVKEWAEDALGMSAAAKKIAGMGGILGAIPQGIQASDIAKVRGLADLYAESNPEFSAELDSMADDAIKNSGSLLISALDKLGLMSGTGYARNEELGKRVQFGQETQAETRKILGSSSGSGDDDDPFQTLTMIEKGDKIGVGSRDGENVPIIAEKAGTKYTFKDDPDDEDDSVFDDIDAQFEAAGVGQDSGDSKISADDAKAAVKNYFATQAKNKGGLATKRKIKRRSPKKTGLAGKR